MPQQTNRIPFGFLDLIGAEVGGKTPPVYADEVKPTVDMTELYLGNTLSVANNTFAHTAAGQTVLVSVPDGETWLLRACSSRTSPAVGAADFEQWNFRVNDLVRGETGVAGAFPIYFTTKLLTGVLVGQFLSDSFYLPRPLSLLSGTRLEANLIQRDANAARTVRIQYLINRMR